MSSTDGASIVIGLIMVVIAGSLNGSWNASFSDQLGLAVGRKTSTVQVIGVARRKTVILMRRLSARLTERQPVDLDYHFAWVLFQLYAAIINIPICISWAGGLSRTAWIVSETPTLDLCLVILFSLLWGVGSVGFGLACRIAGVGLGTNLSMGVIMIMGTLLPLIMEGQATTLAGGIILIGLALCCVGLFFSMKSLRTRDLDEAMAKGKVVETAVSDPEAEPGDQHKDEDDDDDGAVPVLKDQGEKNGYSSPPERKSDEDEKSYSTLVKVTVCVVAGIFATQLQFAFVFGEKMVDLATSNDGPGSTPSSGSAAVIWLFAISVSAPISIVYGIWSSPKHIPLSTMWKCPWYRHLMILLSTSLPWVSHIHLYGFSNSTLPEDIAASVSWPVLMMVTVTTGLAWSIVLGEWKCASTQAKRELYLAFVVVLSGVVVLMSSVAAPS